MARFEIVGIHDCPWFAKAEKLADEIVAFNPSVIFHKEMKDQVHWNDYCEKMKELRGWDIVSSPVVFEILVEIDGKLRLIGNINDFCEYAAMYFDIYYDPTTSALNAMAMANKTLFGRGFEGQDRGDSSILNVSIINAPLDMLELLLSQLLSPVRMLPQNTLLNIHIYDAINKDLKKMNGLLMEITDLASPLLLKASIDRSLTVCLYQSNLVIYAEDLTREKDPTETEREWIERVEMRVAEIVSAMNDPITKISNCRVIVGGDGPQCHIAEIFHRSLDPEIFVAGRIAASGQYIVQAAKNELSKMGNIPAGCITRIHAWGWPGQNGAWVEIQDAVLRGAEIAVRGPGVEIPLAEIASNCDYIFTRFSKDFLILQRKKLRYVVPQAKKTMALTESILTTLQLWLDSEDTSSLKELLPKPSDFSVYSTSTMSFSMDEEGDGPKGIFPVIMCGVLCPRDSTFPEGTFMVQPAICVQGKWQALGKVSEKTNDRVISEVSRLWEERQKAIYRDESAVDATTHFFPDLQALLLRPESHLSQTEDGPDETNYEDETEFLGEMDDYNFFMFRGEGEEE